MNAPHSSIAIKHLVRDTFRQARSSGISWMMLGVTALCAVLCLSVKVAGDVRLHDPNEPALFLPRPTPQAFAPSVAVALGSSGMLDALARIGACGKGWTSLEANPALSQREGIDTVSGRVSLAFGAVTYPVMRERTDDVHFLELVLAGGIAGTLGLLLALVWTAGFMPTFLEASAASVLLAKPQPRWQLLLGKYLGVLAFVSYQVALFVALTWLALGLRTHIWDLTYWWCIPLLVLQFAILYSFSVLLAVLTRSTVACVFGSVLFWLLAWGINYSMTTRTMAEYQALPPISRTLTQAGYWISPKPIDAALIFFNALDAKSHFSKPDIFARLEAGHAFSPLASILSSLVITVILLTVSAYEFRATDY